MPPKQTYFTSTNSSIPYCRALASQSGLLDAAERRDFGAGADPEGADLCGEPRGESVLHAVMHEKAIDAHAGLTDFESTAAITNDYAA